jgi:hypothetical protein
LVGFDAWAQTSLVSGALDGSVSDSSGGCIPGVAVAVRDTATNRTREVSTNAEGTFRITELPVGTCEVSASQPGFAPYRHSGITIQLGATVHLDILLQSAGVTTQVTVTAQPPASDPAQTSVSSAVDKERIEELPVQSRNYLNFVLLAPGVSSSAQQPGRRSLAPLPDSGFTFGGLRGRSNNVSIDGLDNNDEFVGSSRTELSLETVQEFQVVNAGLSAETGGASGGSINVVTRIGANEFHGDAFVFLQNGALNARNPFEAEHASPTFHRTRNINLLMPGPVFGPGRADPRFDNIYQLENSASSTYNGVSFSDCGASNNFAWPGWSLHEELAAFVDADLSPLDTLRLATRSPARFLQEEPDRGTVEKGKIADLVLLDANPLEDIRNTQKIAGVMARGKWYDRKALDRMLAEVEAGAAQCSASARQYRPIANTATHLAAWCYGDRHEVEVTNVCRSKSPRISAR